MDLIISTIQPINTYGYLQLSYLYIRPDFRNDDNLFTLHNYNFDSYYSNLKLFKELPLPLAHLQIVL